MASGNERKQQRAGQREIGPARKDGRGRSNNQEEETQISVAAEC